MTARRSSNKIGPQTTGKPDEFVSSGASPPVVGAQLTQESPGHGYASIPRGESGAGQMAASTPAALSPLEVSPAYLTAEEVGDMLQVSVKSVYRWAKSEPTFPMLKLGGTVRFPRERLLRWLRDVEQGRPRPRMRRQLLSASNPA